MGEPFDEQFVAELSQAKSIREIGACTRAFAQSRGFDHFLFSLTVPTNPIKPVELIVSGFPAEWRRIYVGQQLTRLDPVVQHCAKSLSVLRWSDLNLGASAVKAFMEMSADHGLRDGITCPIAGRRNDRGYFTLAHSARVNWGSPKVSDLERTLHWFTTAIYEAVVRVALTPMLCKTAPDSTESLLGFLKGRLTEREKEMMMLFAAGITAPEIARRMGITERTVWWRYTEICTKLDTKGRELLLARAQSSGALNFQEMTVGSDITEPELHQFDV